VTIKKQRVTFPGQLFASGIGIGVAIGLALGVGVMYLRFGDEIDNYDRVRTYAGACVVALTVYDKLSPTKVMIDPSISPPFN
jgi:hypothetical protein